MTIVGAEWFDPTAVDLTSEMSRLQAASPDVLVLGGFNSAPVGYTLKARTKLGWKVPMVGELGVALTPIPSLVSPADWQGLTIEIYNIEKYLPDTNQPRNVRDFLTTIRQQGPIVGSLQLYALGWDYVMLVKAAAKQANSIETDKIVKALESLKDSGAGNNPYVLYPSYVFSAKSHFPTYSSSNQSFIPYPADGKKVDGMFVNS
jgi:ABC-type branched-subunit amino acid transport system substrate-binding protein